MQGFRIYYADGSREEYVGDDAGALVAWNAMWKTGVELIVVHLETPAPYDRAMIRSHDEYWMEVIDGKARIQSSNRTGSHPIAETSTPSEGRLHIPPESAEYVKKSGPAMPNSVADCQTCGKLFDHINHWPFNNRGFHEFVPWPPDSKVWADVYDKGRDDAW